MAISEQIEVTTGKYFLHSAYVKGLQQYYDEMVAAGLIQPPRYKLPMLDTIGKTIYRKAK